MTCSVFHFKRFFIGVKHHKFSINSYCNVAQHTKKFKTVECIMPISWLVTNTGLKILYWISHTPMLTTMCGLWWQTDLGLVCELGKNLVLNGNDDRVRPWEKYTDLYQFESANYLIRQLHSLHPTTSNNNYCYIV